MFVNRWRGTGRPFAESRPCTTVEFDVELGGPSFQVRLRVFRRKESTDRLCQQNARVDRTEVWPTL